MIIRKSQREIEIMREAGRIVALVHDRIKEMMKPGVTTNQINKVAEEIITSHDATPSFKGYGGFPSAVCASVNEVLVHGFPDNKPLKDGDVVTIDVGACYKGYHGDSGWTYTIGEVSKETQQLLDVTKQSLFNALEIIKPGIHLSDISNTIETYVESYGYGIPREYTGHGIGSNLHEDPSIPNFGKAGRGPILKEGMTIAIEPMVTQGKRQTRTLSDGWTVETVDKKITAHYEHTIVITANGYEILTQL
ncbi:MAG: type I methionyl aminopeptidase [Erysipelotrichales bacterium]